ncbi:MAG: transcription-repair coupling factor [Chitinispirillaceae bacterium]|nr:transcription-repair coupling factor [Chitinispirillaceae bacterium]
MDIQHFSQLWTSPFLSDVKGWATRVPHHTLVSGLAGSSDALVISDLFASTNKPLFVLVENGKKAETLADECATFLGDDAVMVFPSRDAVPYNMKSPFGPTVESRFRVLASLLAGNIKVYIAPHATLLQKIVPQKALFNRIIRLKSGDEVSFETLSHWLVEIGFRRETATTNIGTFSIRGGIVDIYPFLVENPVRVEYWGDTIESIREFDVFGQKSLAVRTTADIFPMREFCLSDQALVSAVETMAASAQSLGSDEFAARRFEHQWKAMADLEGIEWFLHWFDLPSASILDYLHPQTLVVWNDLIGPSRRCDETRQNYERHYSRVQSAQAPFVSKPHQLLHKEADVIGCLDCFTTLYFDTVEAPPDCASLSFDFTEQPHLPREIASISDTLSAFHRDGLRCVVLSPNQGHAERLQELIGDTCPFAEIALGFLGRGFSSREAGCLLFSENQIMGRTERSIKIKKRKSGIPITGYDALSPGDFVVHEDHGIAKFLGVERVQAAGIHTDCMVLLFSGSARVYVPIQDFHKVQKYVGADTVAPALSTIGTSSWERLKAKTRESLKDMAGELIALYAKRQFLEGIAFASDTLWQKEFEDAFVYEETPDQERAIKEVKADMEAKKPMDRLVCGDVGFGKTEVAMRAAFKAVMSGYQAALLAPTTILAAQHYATFCERMASFPVRIAHLSRFIRARDQKTTIAKLATGEVDIVIGTHRLLSKDVVFKNLGLLVIDEEQRFGVRHKEKLKQFRHTIDVLSLTATPIPRTLHMSLVGARDLSIIATPPRNRLPIETRVSESHDDLILSAIENEIERGGQVYFVHNRIKNLDMLRDKIVRLVPAARVITAHGQMHERELETVMKEFIAGRFDVLLSTVIIENGLDIPNVNTIIVNRANAMGLSQLYQLRGRVGRSAEQAYTYLLTPPVREVAEESLLRLRALEQYTELGSGFQIAMRDLEIRGAGNLLGTRQHGFIAAIGFELYCRLLQDAVRELKGEAPPPAPIEVKLDIPLEAYVPTDYIADGPSRIEIYQELSAVATTDALTDLEKSLADRFGPLPRSVRSLLLLVRIKLAARCLGAHRVSIGDRAELGITFEGDAEKVRDRIMAFMQSCNRQVEVNANEQATVLKIRLASTEKIEQAQEALGVLEQGIAVKK